MAAGFACAKYLVLDEADRLLEPTFESELRAILQVGINAHHTNLGRRNECTTLLNHTE